jgi:hypothetical protein
MEIVKTAAEIINGIVTRVIVGDAEWASSRLGGTWIDTTGHQVGSGYTYSETTGFRPERPYPSWSWLNGQWNAPILRPADNKNYLWNEERQQWVKLSEGQ